MSRKIKQDIFAIFVEGESEMIYFKALNQQQWVRDSKYKLNLIRCKNHDELLKIAFKGKHGRKDLDNYNKVAFIFDKDHITKEKFNKLLKLNYIIGFSNPKVELWFLAHYEKLQTSYSDVEKKLKKYFPDYTKTIFKIASLAQSYEKAIENSTSVSNPDFDQICTSVGKIIEEIL